MSDAAAARNGNIWLIRAIHKSWSDTDPESFVSLFTPDGVFEDRAYDILLTGHDQLRAHARRMKKHNQGLSVEILTCDATQNTGVAEWELSHIFTGNFDGVDCTGTPVRIRGLSIYEFAKGRIRRAADYWNYMEIVRCVGILPRELRSYRTS